MKRARSAVLAAFSHAVAFLAFRVLRIRRAHVEACLLRGGLLPVHAKYMYLELARSLAELLAVALKILRPDEVVDLPDETTRRIREARARGPVILFCAHTSNWELVAMHAASRFPLSLIVKAQGVGLAERVIAHVRRKNGVHAILHTGALRGVTTAHARGDVLATVVDQAPARREHGDVESFLGASALVDRAPAILAKRAKAHVFVIFASRTTPAKSSDAHARSWVHAELVCSLTPADVARLSAREIMAETTRLLEAHVRRSPSSWLWLHRRWKDVPRTVRAVSGVVGRASMHKDAPREREPFPDPEKAVIGEA